MYDPISNQRFCTPHSNKHIDAISDSEEHVDSISDYKELVEAISNPKSDPSSNPKVATYTPNGKFAQELLKNQFVSKTIQGAIHPIDQLVMKDVPGI